MSVLSATSSTQLPEVGTAQVSAGRRWLSTAWSIHTAEYDLTIKKKAWVCHDVDKPEDTVKPKESGSEGRVPRSSDVMSGMGQCAATESGSVAARGWGRGAWQSWLPGMAFPVGEML